MGTLSDAPMKGGPMKKTIAKLRKSHGNGHEDPASSSDEHDTHNTHSRTEDYTASVAHAIIREAFAFLNSEEGNVALLGFLTTQARVAASLAVSQGAKEATRITAHEAVKGSYDAAEEKYLEMWIKQPGIVKKAAVPVLTLYVMTLGLALLFTLWRFALFGVS